jgi:hypothetical protein
VRASKRLRSCLGFAMAIAILLAPAGARADFGLQSISAKTLNVDNSIDLQAGSHPFEFKLGIAMNRDAESNPEGALRDVFVDLPAGFVGNPQALPRCGTATFEGQVSACPGNSQVGFYEAVCCGGIETFGPIYNLTPPVGSPARLGFSVTSKNIFQDASLRPGDYGVSVSDVSIPNVELQTVTVSIWGVPADKAHDAQRVCPVNGELVHGCSTDSPRLPFLTLPTSCSGPLATTVRVDSVEAPGVFDSKTVFSENEEGEEAGLENCEAPPFKPTISVQPETNAADSATGLHFGLHLPQNENPDQLATANLKDAVVTLPQGLAVNPSAADGLGACALEGPEGINLPKSKDPNVPEPAAVSEPAKCPPNSKVGTVEARTPLLDHPVKGSVYLAKQLDNPFNSLLALYLAVEDPLTGIVVKIAGKAEPDPVTGQLKATFKENPQLPFEDLELDFFGGPRASLTTPSTCGTYTTTSDLTPWTTPEGKDAFPSDSFEVSSGAGGGSCPSTEAQMPNKPGFEAGTTMPFAGNYSPLLFKLMRENGTQRFGSVDATMPPGLTGKLAGLSECSDAQLALAASRNKEGQGALEKQSPSCPSSSEIGTVTVGAGSGVPFYVQGKAYLAGPYKGAPISFAFITPAIAGPFDLGTVVVRAAAYVDPTTAQITVKSDQIPRIIAGIPLDIRSIAVNADRDRFTLNPTSCDPMQIGASAISTLSQSALLSNRFQVGGCKSLDFKPKIALKLKGGTKRGAFPKLQATYIPKPEGEANLKDLVLRFPRSEFVEQGHFRTICTRVQFAANQCPNASIYGHIKAITPLLDKPLEGPVYLRSSNHNLPDVVFVLKGQIDAQVAVRIDSVKGSLRASLEDAPDVPLSKVILRMQGGKKGLLVNSRDVCAKTYRAIAKMTAHSGKEFEAKPVVKSECGGRKGKKAALRSAGR